MGLDITAYSGPLQPLDPQPERTDDFWDDVYTNGWLVPFRINEELDRMAPLDEGTTYTTTGAIGFRAGSYSGYGAYRDALCRMALGVAPEEVWHRPADFQDKPFFEQIHFGDNEGTLGPEACKALHADYEQYAYQMLTGLDDYFAGIYRRFRRAFEMAAESGGAVDYH